MVEASERKCPTECDEDCEADCHEGHYVYWKREHDPENCLGRNGMADKDENSGIKTAISGDKCPDGGTCHHDCVTCCFRVCYCEPLSGVYPNNTWPNDIRLQHTDLSSGGH